MNIRTNHQPALRGNILLLMLGFITIMLVFAFGFLRSMQMARGGSQAIRQQQLAALAAEMGMQHAIAVSLHEYAMVNEKRDASTMPAVSRVDSPSKNVFNILSPRLSNQPAKQQPPTPWDLAPDVSFNDLYSLFTGTYHISPNYSAGSSPTMILGYSSGWTMHRGYARLFEANRFDYNRNAPYDPSTYNDYDLTPLQSDPPVMPNAAVVSTPFPPVDPFVRGRSIIQRHDLDNPLWLDAEYRPISMADASNAVSNVGAALARYRLRYAICSYDMSPTLWVNTDPAWLTTPAAKADMRDAYREAIYSVGYQFGWNVAHTGGYFTEYGTSLESVILGYGQYGNSRFDGVSGLPLEWASRGGAPMWYRSPDNGATGRVLASVHGSPFMNWFDGSAWRGASLTSWNDLAFAIQNYHVSWHDLGENGTESYTNGYSLVRADHVAHRATTPFGRPYEAATDHPWQVNVLSVPMRVLEAMVAAYVPPVVRGSQALEQHIPWVRFPELGPLTDATNPANDPDDIAWMTANMSYLTGFWATTPGSFTLPSKKLTRSWSGPAAAWNVSIAGNPWFPGPGADLFTDAFRPGGGTSPFASHPAPPNRDYWWSTPTARSDHSAPFDARTRLQRYPGSAFFSVGSTEPLAQQSTRWLLPGSDPSQVESDPAAYAYAFSAASSVGAPIGTDALGRHIVFYDPASLSTGKPVINPPAAKTTNGYLSSYWQPYRKDINNARPARWATKFSPISPFTTDMNESHGLGNYGAYAGEGTQCFYLYPRGGMPGTQASDYTPPDPVPIPDPMNPVYPGIGIFTAHASSPSVDTVVSTAPTTRDTLGTSPAPNPLAAPGTARSGAASNMAEAFQTNSCSGEDALLAPNSYWNRVSLAFTHAVLVTQIANLAHRDPTDARNKNFWPTDGYSNPVASFDLVNDAAGIIYFPQPGSPVTDPPTGVNTVTQNMRKGPFTSWYPAAPHFASLEQVDRQFLANLGESFDDPGTLRTSEVRIAPEPSTGRPRPPRFSRCTTLEGWRYTSSSTVRSRNDQSSPATANSFGYGSYLWVGEYYVTNNIRTLLTPCDGWALTARSTDAQPEPPRKIWLLDEWKADPTATDADSTAYTPGTAVGLHPTPVARTRAKLMERVLNDWRMSFLGSAKSYADDFRPKDFDGDGKVFCSGYLGNLVPETDTTLTCWQDADANGNGPGNGTKPGDPAAGDASKRLTIFSITGCLAFTRSHQYKILVRGELYDNHIGRPVAEKYLETALLVDPDNNIVRSSNPAVLPTGLNDSTIIMRRPIHNYYRGYLSSTYP